MFRIKDNFIKPNASKNLLVNVFKGKEALHCPQIPPMFVVDFDKRRYVDFRNSFFEYNWRPLSEIYQDETARELFLEWNGIIETRVHYSQSFNWQTKKVKLATLKGNLHEQWKQFHRRLMRNRFTTFI